MSSIATRTGDDGSTGLLYGQRVLKDHPQIEAVGAFDELNVALGAIKPHLGANDGAIAELIRMLQQSLVALMGELACAEADANYPVPQVMSTTACESLLLGLLPDKPKRAPRRKAAPAAVQPTKRTSQRLSAGKASSSSVRKVSAARKGSTPR